MRVKAMSVSPTLKRNVLVLAVITLVGAAAYLNWSYNQRWAGADGAMADVEDKLTAAVNAMTKAEENTGAAALPASVSGYFSQARLTRQQSRDQALSLLEMAASAESATQETLSSAMDQITQMANWSLMESRIENELLAKNFAECVVYLSAKGCTVAVPAPTEGLSEAEVARITDAVRANTEYTLSQINVIEVMG